MPEQKKPSKWTKIILDKIIDEMLDIATWMSDTVIRWAQDKNSRTQIISPRMKDEASSSSPGETVPASVVCLMMSRTVGTRLDCRLCPLYLKGGAITNEATSKLMNDGNEIESNIQRKMSEAGISLSRSSTGCLAQIAVNCSELAKRDVSTKEELSSLVSVLNPFQLASLFAIRNFFGRAIKEDLDASDGVSFIPEEEGEEGTRQANYGILFQPEEGDDEEDSEEKQEESK